MSSKKPVDQRAASFASQAQKQLGELTAAMRAAEASLAGLRGALHVPVPKGGSRTIKGSRSQPSIFLSAGAAGFGGFLSGQIVSGGEDLLDGLFGGDFSGFSGASGNVGGSFQQSATQFAAKLFDASLRGQRIR